MPPAGSMWPGGPPLPEWIQLGAKIVAQPGIRGISVGTEAEITKITEAYIHFRAPPPLGGDWSSRPEHFVHDWAPAPSKIDPLSLDLPFFWPEGRPSSSDINRKVVCVASQWCKTGERAVISETKPDVVYFILYERTGRPTYAVEREHFIRQFKPEIPFAAIPPDGVRPGRTWHDAILGDDPF